MESQPIPLPAAPVAPRRPAVPLMAAVVPIAAGVVLWLVSGSLFALCFAALGPLMIVASLVDSARTRRRTGRRDAAVAEKAWSDAEEELQRRQREERAGRWLRQPDAASCIEHPPLRGAHAPDAATALVVGSGRVPSAIRCSGGDGERARGFRSRCEKLDDAPIAVPLGGGVCLRGASPMVAAAARALAVQLCLRFSAPQLSLIGAGLDRYGLDELPHAARDRRGSFRVGVASAAEGRVDADALIWLAASGTEVPEGITTVIDIVEPRRATLRTPDGLTSLAVECLSHAQAGMVARESVVQADDTAELPDAVALRELEQSPTPHGLAAAIGRNAHDAVVVDIVEDGPHAIVTGTTGTGKSELLVTWVTAIATAHGPERVTFVLADFKGGTAFEPLRELPQVAAVITDLDEDGARRGVSSLTAELRRRESVLAAAGVRDVRDAAMPRLVIVVDEFAALLQEHPDLGAVFTDVAARGRALGMHLILGTQRAAGVVRDALAANCPLRISLRLGDAADSRLVLGTDAAAEIPGGAQSRGLGLVRRPEDREPVATRIALTGASDLRHVGVRWGDASPPLSPWLPALPSHLTLSDLDAEAVAAPAVTADTIVLGRADDPAHQSQPLETLQCGADRGLAVLGAPGSGRTALLRTIAVQQSAACWVPSDLEGAWDLVTAWASGAERMPRLVLCDDLDALFAGFPAEHAQQFVHRWEQLIRTGVGATIVVSVSRAAGPIGRLLDALPRRALLRMSSRVEHIAAGGEPSGFLRDRLPGRARVADREVQFAWIDPETFRPPAGPAVAPWNPTGSTALVTPGAVSVAARLRDAYPECEVLVAGADPVDADRPRVIVADAETWQRNWSVWQRVREDGEILIRAEQPADLRQLASVREVPPYASPHAGRAWSVRGGASPRRVVIPALAPG
ncbi:MULTISPECIES: FtsK/SpoIIIE domain-containing protein [unclassified Microbacterium]|uniref:FtsK/SpoIIIE domain-containing protein n=1 Tax=unclassified Microbacterium TaxID=2609290 RepID=UPI000EA93144|nr:MULTISPECIES: FtsK/SpoIIIE domain-containing protein [unclassified Microbacterium]MBT2485536.1 cell division protein FtsK [Microbacterium sp. ISL-108]RKN68324.1 cell division protein FtsK [Microbacterium sp. CGR2]